MATVSSNCIYVTGGCKFEQDDPLIEKFDTELEVWVILSVRLNVNLSEHHHVISIMEGGIEVFGEDYKPPAAPVEIVEKRIPVLEGQDPP